MGPKKFPWVHLEPISVPYRLSPIGDTVCTWYKSAFQTEVLRRFYSCFRVCWIGTQAEVSTRQLASEILDSVVTSAFQGRPDDAFTAVQEHSSSSDDEDGSDSGNEESNLHCVASDRSRCYVQRWELSFTLDFVVIGLLWFRYEKSADFWQQSRKARAMLISDHKIS